MITTESLEAAQAIAEKNIEPARQALNEAKLKFKEAADEVEKPLLAMIEKYYDQCLKDLNGFSIGKGDIISNGKLKYKVVRRGMQFVLGQMCFNPRVMCLKLHPDGTCNLNSKVKDIHPRDLVMYTKIEETH